MINLSIDDNRFSNFTDRRAQRKTRSLAVFAEEGAAASAISQIEMERGGGFFSRRLTVIRSAFIRVYRGPPAKRGTGAYKRQGNIARCRRAKIYCRACCREPKAARTAAAGMERGRERERERGYRRYSCVWKRERNRSGEMRKVEEGEIVNERSRRKNNGGVKREWSKYREREMYRKIWLEES